MYQSNIHIDNKNYISRRKKIKKLVFLVTKMKTTFLILALVVLATSEPSPDIIPIPGGKSGPGITTRYWDCCKPSCAWREANNSTKPVHSCAVDGSTVVDVETQSGCEVDGQAYTCSNQQPWVVNSTLAYGFAAVSFTGGADNKLCCSCLLLSFTGQLQGKQLLVQYINTGGELNVNHFDLVLPGGGVGDFNLGCKTQWNAPDDGWGQRYGGITTEAECAQLPEVLQPGCHFRFGFLEGADNPSVNFYQVKCPAELVAITGCEL